jgi:tRNA (guanine-N7-)-methyltransferase
VKAFYVSLKPFVDHGTLPRPTDWRKIFPNDNPLEVEIGFGNGEYLARICEESPQINFVGFEEYCERISRTLRKLSRAKSDNVRVMRLDVRPAFTYLFAPQSIRFIHCLFPPPWPKKSDIKHRLFTPEFLKLCNNRLALGGGLKVVTDFKLYAEWIEEQVPGTGFKLTKTIVPASYGTKFERKWAEGGQTDFYELIFSKVEHMDVPQKKDAPLNHYDIPAFNPDNFKMEDYSDGKMAVAFKDFLYDEKRKTAIVHLLVHDEHLLQSIRVVIYKNEKGWRVTLAQGSMLMPTPGVAKAIECVKDAIK